MKRNTKLVKGIDAERMHLWRLASVAKFISAGTNDNAPDVEASVDLALEHLGTQIDECADRLGELIWEQEHPTSPPPPRKRKSVSLTVVKDAVAA